MKIHVPVVLIEEMRKQVWRHIEENKVSASHGLASDEYLMQSHTKENPYQVSLKLYTYKNYSVLCGRFQDINAEIDLEACKLHGFDFGRRLTGGGAIIMGDDQLGICLTAHSSSFNWVHIRELYQLFSEPIIQALKGFNISASFRSKNDLEVNGKKIAGLGIHINPEGGIQFHSSLLLDLDIQEMLNVLKIPVQKFADKKMIHSIEQRMTTVRRESQKMVGMNELKHSIREAFENKFQASLQIQPFTQDEQIQIANLEQERYQSEEWIFQNSPQQDMDGMSLKKTAAGLLRTYIALKGETIKSVLITGDFMEMPRAFSQIEAQLKWRPLDKENILEVVKRTFRSNVSTDSDGSISPEEVTEAIWLAAQRAFAANRYSYKGSCYYPKEKTNAG